MQQPNMPGSQNNPIEIVTPVLQNTSQLPNQANMSAYMTPQQLQPSAHINDQRFQQPPPPPQAQGRLPQNTATQQWVQQQQKPHQLPHASSTFASGQPKPWAGVDFSKEPFPMTENGFWKYLGKQHNLPEAMPPPSIEGRQVNLYSLFNLVHKNGGSAKVGRARDEGSLSM